MWTLAHVACLSVYVHAASEMEARKQSLCLRLTCAVNFPIMHGVDWSDGGI